MFGFRKCFIFIAGGTQVCTYNFISVSLYEVKCSNSYDSFSIKNFKVVCGIFSVVGMCSGGKLDRK